MSDSEFNVERGQVGSKIAKTTKKAVTGAKTAVKSVVKSSTKTQGTATSGAGGSATQAPTSTGNQQTPSGRNSRPTTPTPGQGSPQIAPTTSSGSAQSKASTESTVTKAAKVTVPGGNVTPPGRLRKAVLIGINYVNCNDPEWSKLEGCANDVVAVRQFMMEYRYQNIAIMTDDSVCMKRSGITGFELPSEQNIGRGCRHFIPDNGDKPKPGDFFFFYFSGHGETRDIPRPLISLPKLSKSSQAAAGSSDPPRDPYSTILKVLNQAGDQMVDYNDVAFKKDYVGHFSSNDGVQFFVMVDACESGTFIDLPWRYNPEKNIIEKSKNIKMSASKQQAEQTYYKSIKAIIILLSATDSDNPALEARKTKRGLVTSIFTDKIAPILKDGLYDGIALSVLMQTLKSFTGAKQTPYLSMSKKLPENTIINFKNND